MALLPELLRAMILRAEAQKYMLKILRTGMREGDPGCDYKGKLKVACLRCLGHGSEKQGLGPVVYFLWKSNQVTARVSAKNKIVTRCPGLDKKREEWKYPFLVRILELL